MSRLTIDMTEEQHQALKAMAALEGKSIKQYTLEKLFPAQADEEQAWRGLKTLIQDRIEEARKTPPSGKTFDGIVEEALASRRTK